MIFTINSLLYNTSSITICILLLAGIGVFYITGNKLGIYRSKKNPLVLSEGVGPLEGALMGLLALLLSFTFSMSASRFDERRSSVIHEANTIGTAILRAELYPDSSKIAFRKDFKEYVYARIAYYQAGNNDKKIDSCLQVTAEIYGLLWQRAADLSVQSGSVMPHSQMVPALNDMIDAVTSCDASRLARVPDPILWLLIMLTLLVSMIIGYSRNEKKNDWVILGLYSLMTVLTIYTILDLDRPRRGLIKNEIGIQKITELKEIFK